MPRHKKVSKQPFSWTQPVCSDCWVGLKHKIGKDSLEFEAGHHFCCYCKTDIPKGVTTYAIRINPGTTPYPTVRKEEEAD